MGILRIVASEYGPDVLIDTWTFADAEIPLVCEILNDFLINEDDDDDLEEAEYEEYSETDLRLAALDRALNFAPNLVRHPVNFNNGFATQPGAYPTSQDIVAVAEEFLAFIKGEEDSE